MAFLVSRMGKNTERSYIMIKPDGVQRALVGEIISRFEKRGFKIAALKLVQAEDSTLRKRRFNRLYLLSPVSNFCIADYGAHAHPSNTWFEPLIAYMKSGPVVAIVIEGFDAVKTGRAMLGATKPHESAPGEPRSLVGSERC